MHVCASSTSEPLKLGCARALLVLQQFCFKIATLRSGMGSLAYRLLARRCNHFALPVPLERTINDTIGRTYILPEFDRDLEASPEIKVPSFSSGGCMDLMAVPKKKVSPHKRGIRNGPKALKPVPVIVRCKSCGRVKLPHFYCCSGDRGQSGERSDSTS